MTWNAYATDFQLFPQEGAAFRHLAPLLRRLNRVDFSLNVKDATKNRGQATSDFDENIESIFLSMGAERHLFRLPQGIPQELDFAFSYAGRKVAVEIEKTNKEKILRDILKCHMYLQSGADFALLILPLNYPHTHNVWDLFSFGVERFRECRKYGFGTPDKFDQILLMGFKQHDALTGEALSVATRALMRKQSGA